MAKQYLVAIALFVAVGLAARSAGAPAAPKPAPPARTGQGAQQPLTRTSVVEQMKARFRAIDTNGDGVLTQDELASADAKAEQQRIAAIRGRMELEFSKLDTNHDGQLSKAEFMAAAPNAPTTQPNGADALRQLDKNHDGKVTLDEFSAPALATFDRLDTNHDGVISVAERRTQDSRSAAKKQ